MGFRSTQSLPPNDAASLAATPRPAAMITANVTDDCAMIHDPSQRLSLGGGFIPSYGLTYLPTAPVDDLRTRHGSQPSSNIDQQPQSITDRLPQPLPQLGHELSMSAGFSQDRYAPLPSHMISHLDSFGVGSGNDLRYDSRGQQHQQQRQRLVLVPTYLPMYSSPEYQLPGAAMGQHRQGTLQWTSHHQDMHMPMPGYGLVQLPLAPVTVAYVEKPKKRRGPPSPQYLHMTVQEMIDELAYRMIDTVHLQARKAKKGEYIEQLQWADDNGNRGRGAWKSCHGLVPPLSNIKGKQMWRF